MIVEVRMKNTYCMLHLLTLTRSQSIKHLGLSKVIEYLTESVPKLPKNLKYVAPTGAIRLILYITSEDYLSIVKETTYSINKFY